MVEELELEHRGLRFVNAELVPLYPGRTLEAIKGNRRQRDYREILDELKAREVRFKAENQGNFHPQQEEVADGQEQEQAQRNIREGLRPRRAVLQVERGGVLLLSS